MAIQFDKLPTSNPYGLPKPDIYKAKIVEAEMRSPKDPSKPQYLNLKYQLTDHNGYSKGSLYDIMSESESSVVQYKLGRFLTACGIPLVGSMELRDIAKLVNGKEIVVDVSIDESGNRPRAQVDIFSREAYYPVEQFEEIWTLVHGADDGFEKTDMPDTATFVDVADNTPAEVEY